MRKETPPLPQVAPAAADEAIVLLPPQPVASCRLLRREMCWKMCLTRKRPEPGDGGKYSSSPVPT